MDELKMTGNCLKGSRGLVCFDGSWEGEHWSLMKEMFTHVSGDMVYYFIFANEKIRFLAFPRHPEN